MVGSRLMVGTIPHTSYLVENHAEARACRLAVSRERFRRTASSLWTPGGRRPPTRAADNSPISGCAPRGRPRATPQRRAHAVHGGDGGEPLKAPDGLLRRRSAGAGHARDDEADARAVQLPRRVEIGHLLRPLPGGHLVPVVLLHPDALDPEVEIATPAQVHVYILINKQH